MISPTNVEEYANFTTRRNTQPNADQSNYSKRICCTIAPTITLNGDAATVFVGSSYVEPGVVALDGDPKHICYKQQPHL